MKKVIGIVLAVVFAFGVVTISYDPPVGAAPAIQKDPPVGASIKLG